MVYVDIMYTHCDRYQIRYYIKCRTINNTYIMNYNFINM